MPSATYAVKKGVNVNGADTSSATQIVAAVTGVQLGLRTAVISASAACNVTIQDDASTPVVLVPKMYMPANSVLTLYFDEQDTPLGTAGNDLDVVSSTADALSVRATAYRMG